MKKPGTVSIPVTFGLATLVAVLVTLFVVGTSKSITEWPIVFGGHFIATLFGALIGLVMTARAHNSLYFQRQDAQEEGESYGGWRPEDN